MFRLESGTCMRSTVVPDAPRVELGVLAPAARDTPVRAAEDGERRTREDLQVDERRAVVDVPDVELDPLLQRRVARPWIPRRR